MYQFAQVSDDGLALVFGIFVFIFVLMFLLVAIPSYIIYWILYKKAGKPGWTALIPVYNEVVKAQIAGKPIWIGIASGLSTPLAFLSYLPKTSVVFIAINSVSSLLGLVSMGFYIYLLIMFIQKYDKGIGWWLLMIFLPIVGVFYVNKANYRGMGVPQNAVNYSGAPVPPMQPMQPQPQAVPLNFASSPPLVQNVPQNNPTFGPPPVNTQNAAPQQAPSNYQIEQTFMPTQNKNSIIAYYLGFVGIIPVIGLPFAIAAIIYAKKALQLYKENPTPGAKGHAMTGMILGIIALSLWALTILLFLLIGLMAPR